MLPPGFGEPLPTIQYDYSQSPTNDKAAPAVVASPGQAGIKMKPNPIEVGQFYAIVLDPDKEGESRPARLGGRLVQLLDDHP